MESVVKPLQWLAVQNGRETRMEAATPIGIFCVCFEPEMVAVWLTPGTHGRFHMIDPPDPFGSVGDAMEWCKATYTAAVQGCLLVV